MSVSPRLLRTGLACASAALLSSCATNQFDASAVTPTFEVRPPGTAPAVTPLLPQVSRPVAPRDRFASGPEPPATAPTATSQISATAPPLQGEAETLALEQVNLPTFINEVYANALKLTVRIDQRVASRTDVVTLRTGKPLPSGELYAMAGKVLSSYGIAANWDGHVLNFVPDDALLAQMPDVIRSRALPDLPTALRPIFQAVDLSQVSASDMASWLNSVYGTKVKILPSPRANLLLLFGLPNDVRAAVEAVQVLDSSRLAGRQSLRISPTYWPASKLADQLVVVLKAEGYDASTSAANNTAAVMVIPVEANNSIIVLAADSKILAHVRQWVDDFDRPANADPDNNIFIYQVQNTTADSLGATVLNVLGGGRGGAVPTAPGARLEGAGQTRIQPYAPSPLSQPPGTPGSPGTAQGQQAQTPPQAAAGTTSSGARIVVDKDRNAVIVVGTAQDYERVRPVLAALDVPPLEVLIEVTVAELTLNDSTNLGVEWALLNNIGGGHIQSLGTTPGVITSTGGGGGGFGLPAAGFNYTLLNGAGQVRLALNALAQNTKLNVLSTPRVLAKSGSQASIQVGSQVPIVTGQATTSQASVGGNSGILQSIEYQQTGVLLSVNPVVHSGNRVDLTVSQEVSSAVPNTTSTLSTTPVIQNRDIKTELTLADGQTVVLGGLISDTINDNDQGVPYLKDIPVLGLAFKSQSVNHVKQELMVFITPYVISSASDATALTRQFRDQMNNWSVPNTTLQW